MANNERTPVPITPQTVFGALVVIAGVLLVAANFGWFRASDVLSYWPVGVIAIGVAMWRRAPDQSARFSAGVVLVIGAWLTAARLWHFSAISFNLIWPFGLIALGTTLITRAWRQHTAAPGITDQSTSDFAFWSGIQRKIVSPLFRRADFTAVMGGIEVDLRQASTTGEAVIDVFVVMGGLQLRIPPDWAVSNQVVAIMGGIHDESSGLKDAKTRLILRGFVLMGGVEVKS
jgi:predicted membrane protein